MVTLKDKKYKKIAWNCLRIVARKLDELNIPWFASRGTLIGITRENDFIPHDTDVDVVIYDVDRLQIKSIIDAISPLMKLKVIREYNNHIHLIGFRVKLMRVDIDVWYRHGDSMYSIDESTKYTYDGYTFYKLPSNLFETKTIDFHRIKIKVPKNTEEFLNKYIGEDWTTPKDHEEYVTKRDSPSIIPKKDSPLHDD